MLRELDTWQPANAAVMPGGGEGLALAGLRVIDLSQGISGPLCGMQLGDLGTDVIKLEPPQGDWLRAIPPFQGGESAMFLQLNRNKRGIAVDLKTDAGRAFARRLIEQADVVVEGYRPGVMERLGLGYATFAQSNPRLVYCSISGHGTTGPLADQPATELDVQAAVGANRKIGRPQDPPVRFGYDQASTSAGLAAVQGILAALLWRDRNGAGQHVETSLLAAEIAVHQWTFTAERNDADRTSNAFTGIGAAPDHGWRTADGPALINIREYATGWVPFLKAIGLGELIEDPRFSIAEALTAYLDDLREIVNQRLSTMHREEVRHIVEDEVGGGAAFAPMLDLAQVAGHAQTAALGMMSMLDGHPTAGSIRTVNLPWLFGRELDRLRLPAPLLGQHTTEIARDAGCSEDEVRQLSAAPSIALGSPSASVRG